MILLGLAKAFFHFRWCLCAVIFFCCWTAVTLLFSCFSLSTTPAVSLDLSLPCKLSSGGPNYCLFGAIISLLWPFKGSVLLSGSLSAGLLLLPLFLPCSEDLHKRNFTTLWPSRSVLLWSAARSAYMSLWRFFSICLVFLVHCVLYQDLQF